ncbi:MAG: leucine-rich repeat protein [Lachnospiraceae bacterium]|nr:leucine-rich repeat protein [Lachnospiraceae bacterium]
MVKEAAPEEEEAAEAQSEEAEAPEDEEEEEEAPEADELSSIIEIDANGEVKIKGTTKSYGTFIGGVFTVGKDVDYIPSKLFDNWPELTEIRFEDGAICSTIGHNELEKEGAFLKCENLTKVDFNNAKELTAIKPGSFMGCKKLNTVLLNDELQFIEKLAFSGCEELTEIVFKKKLLRIEEKAFSGCKALHKITLMSPNTECKMESGAAATSIFEGCSIDDFVLSTETDENGIEKAVFPANLFNKASFKDGVTIIIPDNVLEISEGAFKQSNIAHVKLSNALTRFCKGAFEGCKSLEEIRFSEIDPKKNKGLVFEDSVFSGCTAIKKIRFWENQDDVTKNDSEIGSPWSVDVKTFGNNAFKGLTALTELRLPTNFTCGIIEDNGTLSFDEYLGKGVFEGCTSLPSIVFPEHMEYVGEAMFRGCTSLTSIAFKKEGQTVSNIKIIGSEAFCNCTALISVLLPEEVRELRKGCFKGCTSLVIAELGDLNDLEIIDEDAFNNDQFYSSNKLPDSLKKIGQKAFYWCGFDGTLVIPALVNEIGNQAFEHNRIGSVKICPLDIAKCGIKIFYENYVREIKLFGDDPEDQGPKVEKIPANLFNQTTWITEKKITIPKSVKVIGNGAFSGGTSGNVGNLKDVIFEADSLLEEIGEGAFQYNHTLVSIILPKDHLRVIGKNAFQHCTRLTSIVIPENVTSIGEKAFYECSLLETLNYNAIAVTSSNGSIFGKCNLKEVIIGDEVMLLPDRLMYGAQFQNVSADDPTLIQVTLELPPSLQRIGEYCLSNVVNLKGIVFKEGASNLKTIGKYAFSDCIGLQSINLPAPLETIEGHAFEGCTKLAEAVLPASVKTIGEYAFKNCISLEGQFELPAELTKLEKGVFVNCEKITQTVIPAGIIMIPNELFMGCKGLVVVGFAGSAITGIGDFAFKDCETLSGIMLPVGIKTIGKSAFQNCKSLERIVIPEGTTKIDANCFAGCTGLTEVSIPASVKSIGNNAFILSECGDVTFLVVPDSYADQWLKKNGFTVSTLKKITYELNGGQNDPENPSGYQVGDTTVLKPATRLGCDFGGWYLEPDFRTEITSVEGMTEDFTVYAKWNLIRYTITYVLNEGTNSEGNPESYTVEDNVSLKKAVKTGFSWGGWYTEPEFTNEIKEIKPGTKAENITLYAKWNEGASSESAFNNTPSINPDAEVQDLWLVQGQKFTMETGWTLANPKADKKYVSLSNKGAFKAKKVTVAPVVLVKGERKINVMITKPEIEKKFSIVHDSVENNESRKVQFTYDAEHLNVYWYSAAPDVAMVDQDGTVTAVGKGKAKITAYIYGCAYNCTVTVNELKTENRTLHVNVGGSKSVKLTKANKPVWSSGNTTIAMMKKSKVTGVAAGNTDLTAVMKDGSIYTVDLTVEDITLKNCQPAKGKNKYNLTLKAGESVSLGFVFVDQEYVFKSSKQDVAYVDEDGWVVAKAAGKTKLTTKINGKTITVNVVVTP